MARPNDDRTAFRCSIARENSAAKLRISGRTYEVNVLDTSRNGFTVRVASKIASKLDDRRKYELTFAGETWEVQRKSSFSESDDYAHVGFGRIRDLTKVTEPRASWWPAIRQHKQADPVFLMFLMVVFLFMCVTLPGIGDKLGTAPRVRDGVHSVMDAIKDFAR